MKKLVLSPPLLMFVVGTRAAMAFGVGLLVAEKVPADRRRRIGLALVALGIATTIPAALGVLSLSNRRTYPRLEPYASV